MKVKKTAIMGAIGVACGWGIGSLVTEAIRIVTPRGANLVHKLGVAIGASLIGVFAYDGLQNSVKVVSEIIPFKEEPEEEKGNDTE